MARLRVRVELSRSGAGVPLHKLASVVEEARKFFLMLGEATNLDGKFSAFGRVVEGMEVLDAIEKEDLDGETPKRRLEILGATVDLQ